MDLSVRLRAVADLVMPTDSLADVGTDHGFLPLFLVSEGKINHAYACDVRSGPLSRACAHIREMGLSGKVKTVLSDGLEQIPDPVDTVVIAGMGGSLICDILTSDKGNAPLIRSKVKQWVLGPQSEPEKVRKAIYELGFRIDREDMVKDRGKYYVILSAFREKEEALPSSFRYGTYLASHRHPVFKEYLLKELETNKTLLQKLSSEETDSARGRISELKAEAEAIKKELEKW